MATHKSSDSGLGYVNPSSTRRLVLARCDNNESEENKNKGENNKGDNLSEVNTLLKSLLTKIDTLIDAKKTEVETKVEQPDTKKTAKFLWVNERAVLKPDLPEEFDDFNLKEKYNNNILNPDEECLFAQQCLNIGGSALKVLEYLHRNKHLLSLKFLQSCNKFNPYQNNQWGWKEKKPILEQDWVTSPGIIEIIKYLHEEMNATINDIVTLPYFDIHLITASGNVDLIKYLYKKGLKPSSFVERDIPVPSGISGNTSWSSVTGAWVN